MFEAEAEAEAKASRLRLKFWPRGHFGLEDLTSLISKRQTLIKMSVVCSLVQLTHHALVLTLRLS